MDVTDPRLPFLSNADGESYGTIDIEGSTYGKARDVVRRLTAQIAAPVRWDLCQETLAELGVTALLELAPGASSRASPAARSRVWRRWP